MNVLIWFKRDLRCQHHPALRLGHEMGRVLPLYIVEPDYWLLPDTSARQWGFTAECLTELRDDLTALGAPLIVRTGDALDCLDKLCRQHHIARIISHEDTGNAWCLARDARVATWCKTAGIEWIVLPQPSAVDLPVSELVEQDFDAPLMHLRPVTGPEPGLIPSAKSLKLLHDACPHRQIGGRSQGLLQLQSFMQLRAETYGTATTSPLTAERACSRLSAHLALGTISVSEVVQETGLRLAQRPGTAWTKSLGKFQRQLALRERFQGQPDAQSLVQERCKDDPDWMPNTSFLNLRSNTLGAWRLGQTGVPFVDACMRYLAATGWLNFAMRAMVMQAATGWLRISAAQAGLHLARSVTDYDPRLHWAHVLAMQDMAPPCPAPADHPIKHSMRQDPRGVFIRRWVPELASVPVEFIHEPWIWPSFHAYVERRYPAPIVPLSQGQGRVLRVTPAQQRGSIDFAPFTAQNHTLGPLRRSTNQAPAQLVLDI